MTSASAEVLTGLFSLAFVAMITPGPNNLVAMSLSISGNPPTQTVIGVASLATPEILFEVEAVAARP